jgi:hypothetical protein
MRANQGKSRRCCGERCDQPGRGGLGAAGGVAPPDTEHFWGFPPAQRLVYGGEVTNEPLDPFLGDPHDPAAALARDDSGDPLTPAEREDVLADLEDLDVFQALLEPKGVRGIVVDCEDCGEPHFFNWDLMRGNLLYLLEAGQTRVHEPAFGPDPATFVSWDYARGYADGVLSGAEDAEPG